MRVLIFGASITQGFYDAQGGWAGRLTREYQARALEDISKGWGVQVFNLGISGDTMQGILERIESETQARLSSGHELTIVLSVGTNDAKLIQNVALINVYDFQMNYEELIKKAKSLTSNVLCMGLTAVDEKLTNPWIRSDSGDQWLNNRLNLFEDTIKQSAMRKDIPFVPIHDKFLRLLSQNRNLLTDGLHPNDEGHELIASWVKPELERLLQ